MNGIIRFLNLKKKWTKPVVGQSLVEVAIATPLLIFMMIGIFEVGWALRSYLVLVNINREITRYAIRPGYLDFSTQADILASYEEVRKWAGVTNTDQLNLNFSETATGTTTMIISHVVLDTGFPCPEDEAGQLACDCAAFDADPTLNLFPQDDIIMHPWLPNYSYQQHTFGPVATITGERLSRWDHERLLPQMIAKNNKFNCEVIKKGGVASANNVIITEMYYDLPQLFGFPLVSNAYTDPIPLYTHTIMRLIGAARSEGTSERPSSITEGINTIGPVCFAFPMVIGAPVDGSVVNLIPDNSWLQWNSATTIADPAEYIGYALQFPQMSLNDFKGVGGQEDILKTGSMVNKVTLPTPPLATLDTIAKGLVGKKLLVPTSSFPDANPVTIDGFAWATILLETDVDLLNAPPRIMASIETPDAELPVPEACLPEDFPPQ